MQQGSAKAATVKAGALQPSLEPAGAMAPSLGTAPDLAGRNACYPVRQRAVTANAAVQSMFRTGSKQAEGLTLTIRSPPLHSAKAASPLQYCSSSPVFSIPTSISGFSAFTPLHQSDVAVKRNAATNGAALLQPSALKPGPSAQQQHLADWHLGSKSTSRKAGLSAQHAPDVAAGLGCKQGLEQNLWGGIGGWGRNGRSKSPCSSAVLQTPRPVLPIKR